MSKYKLSRLEKILLMVTVVVVSLSIILSLCIGLILPPNFIHRNKVNSDLVSYCKCNTNQNTEQINCMPENLEHISIKEMKHNKSTPHRLHMSYLVSLSINAYKDDDLEKRFACTGVIVSSSWILAGQDCIVEQNEWYELEVRAGSVFWSKGGTLHRIRKILQFHENGPVCLNVFPFFSFNERINAVKLSNSFLWTKAYTVYWQNPNIYKNNKYYLEKWSKYSCQKQSKKIGELKNNIMCNVKFISKPLIAGEILVGFQVGVCNSSSQTAVDVFANFQNSDYATWITEIIKFGEPQYDSTTTKNNESITYIYKETENCTPIDAHPLIFDNEEKPLNTTKSVTDAYIWIPTDPPEGFSEK